MKTLKKNRPPEKEMLATSLRIERFTLDTIDAYAESMERSRNWLVNKLLKQSLNTLEKDIAEPWNFSSK